MVSADTLTQTLRHSLTRAKTMDRLGLNQTAQKPDGPARVRTAPKGLPKSMAPATWWACGACCWVSTKAYHVSFGEGEKASQSVADAGRSSKRAAARSCSPQGLIGWRRRRSYDVSMTSWPTQWRTTARWWTPISASHAWRETTYAAHSFRSRKR